MARSLISRIFHPDALSAYIEGLKSCVPIMIGYFPVAITFGMAGSAADLSPIAVILLSVFVYAGASQFLLLASLKAGTPWVLMVALCSLLNVRHLLYGPLLSRFLPSGLRERLTLAFFLTDEVFATALNRCVAGGAKPDQPWLTALGLGPWLAWVFGTIIGVCAGESLEQSFPLAAKIMRFALPALFLALVCQSLRARMYGPVVAALLVACALAAAGHASLAILAAAIVGCGVYRLRMAS